MTPERAEIVGLQALAWLVAEEELLPVFLGASGADLAQLRASAGDPAVLASVLDFLLMDDSWVQSFAAEAGCRPEELRLARAVLPGAEEMNWT
ncbi:DUF3572 domain-containing protein [Pseudoroseicyclus sp. CXY001]|uniref:DUF3572 domain-containing protein n=1 Tax=Pseudoroseicyclus sp. CXY001 TaxID=3242492 RepID=UPI0035715890